MRKETVSLPIALAVLRATAHALAALHAHGLVHGALSSRAVTFFTVSLKTLARGTLVDHTFDAMWCQKDTL